VDERPEARSAGPPGSAGQIDDLDCRRRGNRVVDAGFGRRRRPRGCGLDAHAGEQRPLDDPGPFGAPPLVVLHPVLDCEHVAIPDEEVVAPQAER
jgi:hypothetical protein